MRKHLKSIAMVVAGLSLLAIPAACQQDKSKRPSPPAQASCTLTGGKSVTIDYSSPRMKGRKIFGELVPYGTEWRAGANEATTFVTTTDLMVGGSHVPAGSYTLFTVPNRDKWVLVISKKTGEWGVPYPGAQFDLVRVEMKASSLPTAVENFTIGLDPKDKGCTLRMDWETTRASVDLSVM